MITLLNIIRIIYSHIVISKYRNIKLEGVLIEQIIESHNTSSLMNSQLCMWIKYLKSTGSCKNWNVYQMYRELLYHKKLYKYNLFRSHTEYADFEEIQTARTYLRRLIGNCIL